MSASLFSPLTLAARLRLRPTPAQEALLEQLEAQRSEYDFALEPSGETLKALALYALWRVLAYRGARVTVIAASKPQAEQFIEFLHHLTQHTDPALQAVSLWKRWNHVVFGVDMGQEIRLVPNVPVMAAGRGCSNHLVIALGASSSDPAFVETQKVLFAGETPSGETRISAW